MPDPHFAEVSQAQHFREAEFIHLVPFKFVGLVGLLQRQGATVPILPKEDQGHVGVGACSWKERAEKNAIIKNAMGYPATLGWLPAPAAWGGSKGRLEEAAGVLMFLWALPGHFGGFVQDPAGRTIRLSSPSHKYSWMLCPGTWGAVTVVVAVQWEAEISVPGGGVLVTVLCRGRQGSNSHYSKVAGEVKWLTQQNPAIKHWGVLKNILYNFSSQKVVSWASHWSSIPFQHSVIPSHSPTTFSKQLWHSGSFSWVCLLLLLLCLMVQAFQSYVQIINPDTVASMAHFSQHPTDCSFFYIALSQNIDHAAINGKSPSFSCNSLPYHLPPFSCVYARKLKNFQDDFYYLILSIICPLLSVFCQRKQPCCSPDFGKFNTKPPAVTLHFSCKCYIFTWHYL